MVADLLQEDGAAAALHCLHVKQGMQQVVLDAIRDFQPCTSCGTCQHGVFYQSIELAAGSSVSILPAAVWL